MRVFVLLVLCAAGSMAQQDQEPVIRITSTLVQVDAVVTDSAGEPVEGLTAADFEIIDKKEKRAVSSISYVAPGPIPEMRANAPVLRATTRRTIVIVVDDIGISWQSLAWARKVLMEYFREPIADGDLVALATTSGGMGIYQQFTRDGQLLQRAAERLRWNAGARATVFDVMPAPRVASQNTSAHSGAVSGASAPNNVEALQNAERAWLQTGDAPGLLGMNVTRSRIAITGLIRALKNMPGRKSIVMLSEGIRSSGSGRDGHLQTTWARELTDEAARAAVTIHTINPSAPDYSYLTNLSGASVNSPEDLLFSLADQTGGLYLGNPGDVLGAIRKAFRADGAYYLLGFQPPQGAFDGKFHEIEVRLKRPGLKIRARRGYIAKEDGPATVAPGGQLFQALLSPFTSTGIRTRLTTLFGAADDNSRFLQALVFVDTNDLTFSTDPNGRRATKLQVLVVAMHENGRRGAVVSQSYRISLDEQQYRNALRAGLTYALRYEVKDPGAVQVRAALLEDGSGKLGSASQFVDIPEMKIGKPVLSGVILASADGDIAPHPLSTPASRVFPAGRSIAWRAQLLYRKPGADAGLQYKIRILRDARAIAESPVLTISPASAGRTEELSGELRLSDRLPAGPYVLQLEVFDGRKLSLAAARDFEVIAE